MRQVPPRASSRSSLARASASHAACSQAVSGSQAAGGSLTARSYARVPPDLASAGIKISIRRSSSGRNERDARAACT